MTYQETGIVDQVGNREQVIMNAEKKGANMHAEMMCMKDVLTREVCVGDSRFAIRSVGYRLEHNLAPSSIRHWRMTWPILVTLFPRGHCSSSHSHK